MNKTKYLQRDGRWGGLPYPKKPCYIRDVGCGEVSIANILIEMEQYAKYTPRTIQPYCKQYGAPGCEGTYLSGICKMMKHYGLTDVKECDTMPQLWKEMAKGDRVAVLLMGSRPAGSKKIHWTSGGHFIAAVDYRLEDKQHYLYIKDPWTDAKDHNGWLTYEGYLKGDVVGVYVGKTTKAEPKPTPSGKLTVDGIGGTDTVLATQKYFGTKESGIIGDQLKKLNEYYPSITAVKYGKGKNGSIVIKALQKWLGLTQDGIIGKGTTAAWQAKLRDLGYLAKNEKIDGIFGVKSMKAWQKFLNDNQGKHPENDPPKKKTTYKVIDVSDWQGQIDWSKVKADGVVGAIIRYADGDVLDKRFIENMKNAKANGIHIGSYIFSRAKTKAEAEKEAERLFMACLPFDLDMPMYIDLEVGSLSKYANTVAQAFIAKIKALGGKPGVYANLNWWNKYLADTAKLSFAMWVAQYNDTMDYKPASYVGMWQYSSSGSVKGISGKVDMDELYIPYWDTAPKFTEAEKIATLAKMYCGDKTKPTDEYAKAANEVYGKGNDTNCHRFVGTVLAKLGYGKMTLKWASILTFLKANFEELTVDYTAEQLKEGDIRVRRKGTAYHIWIIEADGKKAESAHNKTYPHIAVNNATTKYTQDWLFRAKEK